MRFSVISACALFLGVIAESTTAESATTSSQVAAPTNKVLLPARPPVYHHALSAPSVVHMNSFDAKEPSCVTDTVECLAIIGKHVKICAKGSSQATTACFAKVAKQENCAGCVARAAAGAGFYVKSELEYLGQKMGDVKAGVAFLLDTIRKDERYRKYFEEQVVKGTEECNAAFWKYKEVCEKNAKQCYEVASKVGKACWVQLQKLPAEIQLGLRKADAHKIEKLE